MTDFLGVRADKTGSSAVDLYWKLSYYASQLSPTAQSFDVKTLCRNLCAVALKWEAQWCRDITGSLSELLRLQCI